MREERLPDMDEQTELTVPLKFPFRVGTTDRARMRRAAVAAAEDDFRKASFAVRVFRRQKTNIVIQTEEELEAFEYIRNNVRFESRRTRRRFNNRFDEKKEAVLQGESPDQGTEVTVPDDVEHRVRNTDMEKLLTEDVVTHAETWSQDVFDGTVDVSKISFFWNPYLTDSAGMAYSSVPNTLPGRGLGIGLSKDYYYARGRDELLRIVRHELIHIWQYISNGKMGHGKDFRQWVSDMNTDRHCRPWNRKHYEKHVEG